MNWTTTYPPELIAQRPLAQRDASRLLTLNRRSGVTEDRAFSEFPGLLRGDELLVLNNARVIPARLFGHRAGRSFPGALQSHPRGAPERQCRGSADPAGRAGYLGSLVRPGRKLPVGERIRFGEGALEAENS